MAPRLHSLFVKKSQKGGEITNKGLDILDLYRTL